MLQDWLWKGATEGAEIQGSELVKSSLCIIWYTVPWVPAPFSENRKQRWSEEYGEKLILGRERQEAEREGERDY